MPHNDNKAGLRIADQTPAGESGVHTVPVSGPGTVERVSWRIYPGAETTMRLRPVVVVNGSERDLLNYSSDAKTYIDGDDDDRTVPVSEPVPNADAEIGVRYDNRDNQNAHNWAVDVSVDYMGNAERVAHTVTDLIPGVGR